MPKPDLQVLVCVNQRPAEARKPSCAPRGGLAVYRRLKDLVRERGLRDGTMVVRTGCLKHCSQGVTVCVWPLNLWYRRVGVEDAEEIVERSLLQKREVERLRMPDIPWE